MTRLKLRTWYNKKLNEGEFYIKQEPDGFCNTIFWYSGRGSIIINKYKRRLSKYAH